MRNGYLIITWALMLSSCSPSLVIRKKLTVSQEKFNDHIGFILYDPEAGKTLLEFNSGKYFTPASNTKIFTLYTSIQVLGDSIPALKYTTTGDSLIFWGTGDPSFLYREVHDNRRVYDFLSSVPQKLYFSSSNFQTEYFGPGWAWDDYLYAFSVERTPFPVYGNLVEVNQNSENKLSAVPDHFDKSLVFGDSVNGKSLIQRDMDSNQLVLRPGKKSTTVTNWKLPFHLTDTLVTSLLSDTLKRKVETILYQLPKNYMTLNSVPADTLYKKMMQQSDNFIAEQLLLLCAGTLSDTLAPEIAIRYAKKNLMFDLPDKPVWVDGSGLSRYNLVTPRSIVRLWEKIYQKVPKERLFGLLASGSQSGTLKNWYMDDQPYVFGKTGFLSNNLTLSGYLVTKKNRTLIFSFMNSNFIASTLEIRHMMQEILLTARNEY